MQNKRKEILYKDWIYEWLLEKKIYIKESTYACYSNNIFNHIIPELGNYYLKDINHKIIQTFLLNLANNENKLSSKTIKDISIIIKGSIKKGINEKLIDYFELDFYYPKDEKKKNIYILTKEEQEILTEYAIKHFSNQSIGLLLALYSGIRIGELCALKWEDIDFKSGIIKINKTIQRIYIKNMDGYLSKVIVTNPKTKNSYREIPINKKLLKLLKQFNGNKKGFVISKNGNFVEPRTYRKYFNRTLKVNSLRHINFHSLRHTFATNCISLGANYKTVSELLGHANINITLNLYVHPRMNEKKKCINLVSKVFEEKIN